MKKRTLVLLASFAVTSGWTAMASDGAAIYKSKCSMCHGADASGNTQMGKAMGLKDMGSAEVQKMSDADLSAVIAKGKGKMPAYGGKISDEDINALVKYIRTLKK
jgi:mono/diheme cytochrome c family protein